MELSLASVEGDSSLDMLTPEHEAKSGDRRPCQPESQYARAINKIKLEDIKRLNS